MGGGLLVDPQGEFRIGAVDFVRQALLERGWGEIGLDAVERAVEQYRTIRAPGERFIDTYRRVGMDGFKEAIYGE